MVIFMQILTILVNTYISFSENKKRIYIAMFLLNLSLLGMYIANNDLTTTLVYIVITIRSLVYLSKDKFKTDLIPYSFINIHMIICCFTIESGLHLFSILIACFSCWYLWFYNDTQKLRIGHIIAHTAWAIYNICTGLYIVLIMRFMAISSNVIAYVKRKNELERLSNVSVS